MPEPDEDWGEPPRDERRTRLDAIAAEGSSFRYTYDLGDGWDHRVLVEKVEPATTGIGVPACVDRRRACPPEDCGGTWAYRELLAILVDPTHPSTTSAGSGSAASSTPRRSTRASSTRTSATGGWRRSKTSCDVGQGASAPTGMTAMPSGRR
ncbi:MAG: plasmid pRiA4b ORF-3 family protein [Acidimicrobiales bacterium]